MARKKQAVTDVTTQILTAEGLVEPLSAPAAQPQIAGNNVPATMLGAGDYFYEPAPILGQNGRAEAVVGPYARLRWRFYNLSKPDFLWIVTTVLQGQPSRAVTSGTTLYNHKQDLTEIASCTVLQPTYKTLRNGRYIDVELMIDRIVPA